jgi:hypothetical protein
MLARQAPVFLEGGVGLLGENLGRKNDDFLLKLTIMRDKRNEVSLALKDIVRLLVLK